MISGIIYAPDLVWLGTRFSRLNRIPHSHLFDAQQWLERTVLSVNKIQLQWELFAIVCLHIRLWDLFLTVQLYFACIGDLGVWLQA